MPITIFLLMGGGFWAWWSHAAAARLQSQIDQIRQRHEPLVASEFVSRAVPTQQNSVTYLLAAISALSSTAEPPSASTMTYEDYPPFPPEWHRMARQSTAANGRALLLAHQAAGCMQADWSGSALPWGQLRSVAKVIGDAAIEAHLAGDDALAIQRIEDVQHEADAIQCSPSISGYLVGIGIGALANERLECILPDLGVQGDVAPGETSLPDARPASVDSLKRLIAELLDESSVQESLHVALLSEQCDEYVAVLAMRKHATLLQPLFDLQAARTLQRRNSDRTAAEQANYPAAAGLLTKSEIDPNNGNIFATGPADPHASPRYSRVIGSGVRWSNYRVLQQGYRYSAVRRTLAIALAIGLYRAQNGRWPTTLDALVPDFLPSVPRDPLVAGDEPIALIILHGVLPGGADRPMLRFGAPATGTPAPPPATPSFDWYQAMPSEDIQWRDLSRWYLPAPATEPADAGQTQ